MEGGSEGRRWGRVRLFTVATVLQLVLLGFFYALSLWVVTFKDHFAISQTQANAMGTVNYGVASLGFIVAPLVLPHLSPTVVAVTVAVANLFGLGLMTLIAKSIIHGTGVAVFALLLLAISASRLALGVWFALHADLLFADTYYGPSNALMVSGIGAVSLASGGVAAGSLYYFSPLSLGNNLVALSFAQAALTPVVVGCVYGATVVLAPLKGEGTAGAIQAEDELTSLISADHTDPVAEFDEAKPEPQSLGEFLRTTVISGRFWHVALIILCKVGIGGTFTTNFGSELESSLSESYTTDEVASKVALAITTFNFGQVFGRVCVLLSSLRGGNSNRKCLVIIMLVSAGYIVLFWMQAFGQFSYNSLLITGTFFGVVYGAMWTTSMALIPFLPNAESIDRVLAVIMPIGGIGPLIFNYLAGRFYDAHAEVHTDSGLKQCQGPDCYRDSNIFLLGCSVALLLLVMMRYALGYPDKNGRWAQ